MLYSPFSNIFEKLEMVESSSKFQDFNMRLVGRLGSARIFEIVIVIFLGVGSIFIKQHSMTLKRCLGDVYQGYNYTFTLNIKVATVYVLIDLHVYVYQIIGMRRTVCPKVQAFTSGSELSAHFLRVLYYFHIS